MLHTGLHLGTQNPAARSSIASQTPPNTGSGDHRPRSLFKTNTTFFCVGNFYFFGGDGRVGWLVGWQATTVLLSNTQKTWGFGESATCLRTAWFFDALLLDAEFNQTFRGNDFVQWHLTSQDMGHIAFFALVSFSIDVDDVSFSPRSTSLHILQTINGLGAQFWWWAFQWPVDHSQPPIFVDDSIHTTRISSRINSRLLIFSWCNFRTPDEPSSMASGIEKRAPSNRVVSSGKIVEGFDLASCGTLVPRSST